MDYLKVSGRFYVDVEDIIKDEEKEKMVSEADSPLNPYQPLQADELLIEVENYLKSQKDQKGQKDLSRDSKIALSDEAVATLVEAARIAPSAGNNQPWKWVVMQDTFSFFTISTGLIHGVTLMRSAPIPLSVLLSKTLLSKL